VSTGSERARLFVALDLPQHVRDALERWRRAATPKVDGLRMVGPDALHVTLCFLGWRPAGEIEPIGERCATAVRGLRKPELSFGGPVWLPERRPRVLAVALEDRSGALARIQAALSAGLSAGGWYGPEARPFLAHVTVARVGRGTRVRAIELSGMPPLSFSSGDVTLYRSHLGAGGARYEALRTVRCGSCADAPAADPVEVVGAFHLAQGRGYAGGDLDELRAWLVDDVVWHVPGRSRIAGEHRGVDAVLSYFALRRRMTDETFRVSVHGAAAIGDRVVQLAGGSAARDGRPVHWETVGVFRVVAGRIAECWLVPFDLDAFDRIWS
jgi:2'-5' RNA ligase